MNVRETGMEDVDWIHLANGSDRWRAAVKMVMTTLVP
jgi:hypothetical protein